YFSRREQALYLQTMDFMRYGAAAIGTTELSYGLDHFRAMGRGVRTPYLAANLLAEGRPLAPPAVLPPAGPLPVAVIGRLEPPPRNYGRSSARLGPDRDGRFTSAAIENHWLTQEVRDDPAVRGQLDRFYDEVGRIEAAQASVKPLFGGDPVRLEGRYVGAGQCRDCHQREYAQWKTTRHAGAYKTLLDVH